MDATSVPSPTSAPQFSNNASPSTPDFRAQPQPTVQPPRPTCPNRDSLPHPVNPSPQASAEQPVVRFTPSEEEHLITESNSIKATANATFARGDFSAAIAHYDRALASCPTYLDFDVAVLKTNIAACHLKLQEWKDAVESASASLDCLERLLPSPKSNVLASKATAQAGNGDAYTTNPGKDSGVVELEGDDEAVSAALEQLNLSDQRKQDILRIRAKSLLRRARARSQLTTWSDLQGAEDDYRTLAKMSHLPPADRKVVELALGQLPGRVKEAREREVGEMMGKLKDLGNTCLKPFGLSTDMFNIQQGEGGGYSISMNT